MFGFLNINKPKGHTSRDVVNVVQRLIRPAKVGHAGTLDPLATGVLVVCVGPATRLTEHIHRMPKSYLADFRLGFESDTEDILGDVTAMVDAPTITRQALVRALPAFVGEISQRPPHYSALKVDGKRAYALARQGKTFELKSRPIKIHGLDLVNFEFPDFKMEIECGSGTYVRSLGRDIAREVGTAAIMTNLVRTAIGPFRISDAVTPNELSQDTVSRFLIPPQQVLTDLKTVVVSNEKLQDFANGCAWRPEQPVDDEQILAIDESDRLLAILHQRDPRTFTPKINFSKYWMDALPPTRPTEE